MPLLKDHLATGLAADVAAPWRERAACQGRARQMEPPSDADDLLREEFARAAKRVCFACPVMAECRTWVLGQSGRDDPGGVCGGLTESERMRARMRMARRAPAGSMPPPTKRCGRCGKTKPAEDFKPSTATPDGLSTRCESCREQANEQSRRRRARRRQQRAGEQP